MWWSFERTGWASCNWQRLPRSKHLTTRIHGSPMPAWIMDLRLKKTGATWSKHQRDFLSTIQAGIGDPCVLHAPAGWEAPLHLSNYCAGQYQSSSYVCFLLCMSPYDIMDTCICCHCIDVKQAISWTCIAMMGTSSHLKVAVTLREH